MVDSLIQRAAAGPKARREAEAMFEMIDKSMISAQDREKLKQGFYEKVQGNEIVAAITAVDRNRPAEAVKKLSTIKALLSNTDKSGDFVTWTGIDPAKRNGFIEALNVDIEQMKGKIETQQREAMHIRNENAKSVYESWKDLAEQGSFNPNLTAEVHSLVKGTRWESNFKTVLEKTTSVQWRNEQIEKHGIKFLANYYGIPMTDLNIMQPLKPQIEYRKAAIKEIFQKSGVKLSPLTPQEADSFTSLIQKQNIDFSLNTINELVRSFGKENSILVAEQLSKKDPHISTVISMIAEGKTNTAEKILEGTRYLREKAVTLPISKSGTDLLKNKFETLIGDAMTGLPLTQQRHYEAFKSYYAALAGKAGDLTGDTVDNGLASKAFKEVVGETASISGKKIILRKDTQKENSRTLSARSTRAL